MEWKDAEPAFRFIAGGGDTNAMLCSAAMRHITDLESENARMREALTPSAEYGTFGFWVESEVRDYEQAVPAETVEEIMAAIRKRAGVE